MSKKWSVVLGLILFVLVFCGPAFASKTMFKRDMTKLRKYLNEEYTAVKQLITSLSPDDVKTLNSGGKAGQLLPPARMAVQEFSKQYGSRGRLYPKTKIYPLTFSPPKAHHYGGLWITVTAGSRDTIFHHYYQIPAEEEPDVVREYCQLLLEYLDKLQTLVALTDREGLTRLGMGFVFFTGEPSPFGPPSHNSFVYEIAGNLYESAHAHLAFYQIKEFIACEKAWLEYALNNLEGVPLYGDNAEERFVKELDYIAKIEASLVPKESSEPSSSKQASEAEDTGAGAPSTSAEEPSKSKQKDAKKFRLELPQ